MIEKTIFEKIISGEFHHYKVYEDDDTYAFLDAFPSVYGHTLVVPKKPYKNIYEIPDNLDDKLFKTVKKMAKTIKKALDADGINIVMNNESAAGQIVFHAHIHILPRFENDNGYQGERLTYPEGKAKEIADKIIACL